MPRTEESTKRPPYAWERVLYFANASPTANNWVAVLLQSRTAVPIQRTYGFDSLDDLRPVLDGFRGLLSSLVATSIEEAERSNILDLINKRAAGILRGWTWYRGTGRVFPQIRTLDDSFEQSLYAQLAVAMTAESFTSIKQCKACQRFFYKPRQRTAALCSNRCRAKHAKVRAARYRETHRDEYREYQRGLMRRRRRRSTP